MEYSGYYHRSYAESLGEHGRLLYLPKAESWLLERPIPGTDSTDATGCYPLLCCRQWSRLREDLEAHTGRLVSVTGVADPFGAFSMDDLREAFERVQPFKEHFVVDLAVPPSQRLSKNHRRNSKQAARKVRVELCQNPLAWLDTWVSLYRRLMDQHQVRGLAAFSREAFQRQFQVPGLVALRGTVAGAVRAMTLWFVMGKVAYYHLAASDEVGYRNQATYALVAFALDHLKGLGCEWVDLGSGPGLRTDEQDGLSYFKKGWSTGTRTAYLCGKILDRPAYDSLVAELGREKEAFFPAYRALEYQGRASDFP